MQPLVLADNRRPRILLSGVFGPFGVDDAWGRKENVMELFHNQVTREQELASFRFHHRSFGLYFLAQNVDAEVTVLDFPSKRRFEQELKKGDYDVVGISFITPNFKKAQEMARLVRLHRPKAQIVLGGHGAAIPNVDKLIECDHVVRGEGIRWLRAYLGQDPNAPLRHPILPSTERQSIFGLSLPGVAASLLVPGVGCVNGCRFCATTHFFDKAYTSYVSTGAELFDLACRITDARGTNSFFVMDENFLKSQQRAQDLLDLCQERRRFFNFEVFSSAETVAAFGIENLVRLGVNFLWVGVESSSEQGNYVKNRGIDAKAMIRELRDHGISVLASGILCQEHHTPDNMQVDIDFMVDLQADFVQFMLLTGLPVTGLYREFEERGVLRDDLPWEEWHGQKHLAYRHPHFPGNEAEKWLREAFRRDYRVNSSSIYRVTETALRGYRTLLAKNYQDPCWQERLQERRQRVLEYSMILPTIARNAVNAAERERVQRLTAEIRAVLPEAFTAKSRALATGAQVLASLWKWRVKLLGDMIQPSTIVTRYDGGIEQREGVEASAANFIRLGTKLGTEWVADNLPEPAASPCARKALPIFSS